MRGLDLRIHDETQHDQQYWCPMRISLMDCRLKPGNDEAERLERNRRTLLRILALLPDQHLRPDIGGAVDAAQRHGDVELLLEDVDRLGDAGLAAGP